MSAMEANAKSTSVSIAPRQVRFEFTLNCGTYYSIDVGFNDTVEVIGDRSNASYEWWILRKGLVIHHSDCGYGTPESALRDGLIAFLGLPSEATMSALLKIAGSVT